MAVKNKDVSALTRLKNQAKEAGMNYQMVLQLFLQEEFLRRLSISKYRSNFVLKGGMFIYTLTNFESRPTQDIDFMLRQLSNDLQNIEHVMTSVCEMNTGNDFILIELIGISQITPEKKYPGVKIKFMGRIGNVRIPFSIDIGVDDIIVPEPKLRKIPARLSDYESPEILTYSIESTVAEKFDTILMRMETNSRMKDYYDLYYLSGMFSFDGTLMQEALQKTMDHRKRLMPDNAFERIMGFAQNEYLSQMWIKFKPAMEAELSFEEALSGVEKFIKPVFDAIIEKRRFYKMWNNELREWMDSSEK